MKASIQPKYYQATVTCNCGNTFVTGSTKPEIHVPLRDVLISSIRSTATTSKTIAVNSENKAESTLPCFLVYLKEERLKKATISEQHCSGIGGQAVLEGVMMKNGNDYAVAVRKENGEIVIKKDKYEGIFSDLPVRSIPVVRGFFVLIDSLVLGLRVTDYSASMYDPEDSTDPESPKEKLITTLILIASLVIAVGLFILLPYTIASFVSSRIGNSHLLFLIEGILRLAIFLTYISAISAMKDIRRLYQYHGAEHKCINCLESGLPLTVENARKSTRLHKRCGSSFTMFVMLVSIILFFFIRTDSHVLRVVLRILLIPVISGVSYEIIRLAGNSNNPLIQLISKPGLWMQLMTTKEPDDDMIRVGIASVEAVFDWKSYLSEDFGFNAQSPDLKEAI